MSDAWKPVRWLAFALICLLWTINVAVRSSDSAIATPEGIATGVLAERSVHVQIDGPVSLSAPTALGPRRLLSRRSFFKTLLRRHGDTLEVHEHEEVDLAELCAPQHKDRNTGLRVGLLFVILATSAIGVFLPMVVSITSPSWLNNLPFIFLTQFGTGVIFSTAFIHLLSEAIETFENPCIGELSYEPVAAAIAMAGILISFLLEYAGERYIDWKKSKNSLAPHSSSPASSSSALEDAAKPEGTVTTATPPPTDGPAGHSHHHHHPDTDRAHELLSVLVLEGGIIFHSLLIGLTVAVAENAGFKVLYIVVLFHQMFEGIALGSRIAALSSKSVTLSSTDADESAKPVVVKGVSAIHKFLLGLSFALITPIGMAIGLGVANTFNDNDKSTLIAIGTLNAFSAGILIWCAIVEMWSHDWLHGGQLARAGPSKTFTGLFGLLLGIILMSLLGKWA